MSHLRRLWAGMLTRNIEDAGTDSRIALTVEGTQLTFPDTAQEDQERGRANLYKVEVQNHNIIPENLNNSSIRAVILGSDGWRLSISLFGVSDSLVGPLPPSRSRQASLLS